MQKSKKRVGILTFHFSNNNFGAILQTYASYKVLSNLGLDPKVLNLLPESKKSLIGYVKNLFVSYVISYSFESFKQRNLALTKRLYSFEDCKNQNDNFDMFYVGSDQVWRPIMARERLYRYFLDFVEKGKTKIAYAPSFGVSSWEGSNEQALKISNLLNDFDFVSVREESGISICKNVFGINACNVIDPTLLLSQDEYNSLINSNPINNRPKDPYVGFYLLDDIKGQRKLPKLISNKLGMHLHNLYGENKIFIGRNFFKYNTIEGWLSGIKHSEFVITDSFHCVIFCLIFQKNFICIVNEKKGVARLRNFLAKLGLQDRLVYEKDIDVNIPKKEINYNSINDTINSLRENSYNLISNAISSN